ncbi:MAG: hypothetical protein HN921_09010 [Bacteroidetes bacterium]|jgi:hypothetical protein|nr:hypothetical protein [Bacteroidota bacterium]
MSNLIKCPRCPWKNEETESFCEACGLKLRNMENNISTLKVCPFCAENIKDTALVCNHCERALPNLISTPTYNQEITWEDATPEIKLALTNAVKNHLASNTNLNSPKTEKGKNSTKNSDSSLAWIIGIFIFMNLVFGWEDWLSWLLASFFLGGIISHIQDDGPAPPDALTGI